MLGSCATVAREQLGGPDGFGRGLVAGDELRYHGIVQALRDMPREHVPVFTANPRLDVILGAQIGDFTGQSTFDAPLRLLIGSDAVQYAARAAAELAASDQRWHDLSVSASGTLKREAMGRLASDMGLLCLLS